MSFLYQLKNISLYLTIAFLASCVSAENSGGQEADATAANTTQAVPVKSVSEELGNASKNEIVAAMTKAETELYGSDKNNLEFDKTKAQRLVDTYNVFTGKFPKDAESANYLFKTAEVLRSLRKFNEAVGVYSRIGKDFPDFEKAPHSLFLEGFSYENDLNDLKKAEVRYQDFIEKYPKHELADDVQFSLDNLGKSPEDIIKGFEKKREAEGK